ncbi:HAD-IIIC family phosphatase [Ruegeria sp. SCPT10]|uniref:HAD-IIIC family phosphatase n=1 Tax=Ruegeria sp. SCP10 TaxID=3141377 RepID=UPI00333DED6F
MDKLLEIHKLTSSQSLRRSDLIDRADAQARNLKIDVVRNHSFELVAATINSFLAVAGLKADFSYSDYDDAFANADFAADADAHIIWVDLERYDEKGRKHIIARLNELSQNAVKPVIVAPVGANFEAEDPLVKADFSSIMDHLGGKFFDERLASFTGTRCSPAACMEMSRLLGLCTIPAVILPGLKAIVVDLDNTLYKGVLGEDGAAGVILEPGHIALQQKLTELARQGFFVCIASKNEAEDVEKLFKVRGDFPLRPEHVTKFMVNWESKSSNIQSLEKFLNIHHSAMLFIDDNMGELFEVSNKLPDIKMLWASPDSASNARSVGVYPGLLKSKVSAEDVARSKDVQANEERRRLREQMSPEAYLRSLEIKISFQLNHPDQITRVSELSRKTNQFIFNYKRYSLAEVKAAAGNPSSCVMTVSMSDKLIDSGIIGCLVGHKHGDTLNVEDMFVSCRALGRGLDEVVVLGAIKCAADQLKCSKVQVAFQKGERNGPAADFVENNLKAQTAAASELQYTFPQGIVEISMPELDVKEQSY